MQVFHGTSKQNSLLIAQNGLQKNVDTINIDNQGYSTFIDGFFVTPNKDIAHIYECDNSKNGAVIVEIELLDNANILDLTNKQNQENVKTYLCNSNKTMNDYLLENDFDGCRQYHKNDFGSNRLEYAIVNIDLLTITKIPKTATKFMSLYSEAMQGDIDVTQYL